MVVDLSLQMLQSTVENNTESRNRVIIYQNSDENAQAILAQ